MREDQCPGRHHANANDTAFVNWYRDSATIRTRSQVDLLRSLGYTGLIHVLQPSTGLRPNWPSSDSNWREMHAKGCDWTHQMDSYMQVADVYPWCTWMEQNDFTTPVTQESHKAPWKFMRDQAIARGRSTYVWGENAAGANDTQMDNIFTIGALANGLNGLLWVDWGALNGGPATLANLAENIAAYTGGGPGGPVVLAGTTSTSASALQITGTKPSGTVGGDVLIAIHSNDVGTDSLPPSPGWTDVSGANVSITGIVRLKAYWADGAVASTTFENVTTSPSTLTLIRLTGVVGTPTFVAGSASGGAATSTAHNLPSITPTTSSDLLISAAASRGGGVGITWTPPGGLTERSDVISGTANAHSTASLLLTNNSPTGTGGFTASRADRWVTISIAVSP